jgi:pyrimidine-nucleoside phosphorylase
MVETGERSGTRTAALLTNMNQPLGRFAGNWIEIAEALDLLAGKRNPLNEDLRKLSLILAGWMIFLGGVATSAKAGRHRAEEILQSGAALKIFTEMVETQGGDTSSFAAPEKFHQPGATKELRADRSGYLAQVDCTQVGWAVQRLGAGRARSEDPVSAHAGLEMHIKLGGKVQAGELLCMLFADRDEQFAEPETLLRDALVIGDEPLPDDPLIQEIITAENRKQYLEAANHP